MAKEEKGDAPKGADAELRLSPDEWAPRKGMIVTPRFGEAAPHWKHACADVLYGWTLHRHHYADKPLLLSESDYVAALDAAAEYPATPAHEAAFSPVVKRGN